MIRIVLCSLILVLINGCYSFYREVKPRKSIVKSSYYNEDTSFVLKDYAVCLYNGRYSKEESISVQYEDSILKVFLKSISKLNVDISLRKGNNINQDKFSFINFNSYPHIVNHIDSLVTNSNNYDDTTKYIIPYIKLVDGVINTSFNTGNVYVNSVSAGVLLFIIKNRKIIYSKFYHGDGVGDDNEKVTDDWPNYPEPPDILYEQAHWDTLVGLAMKDYMKRLNVN